MSRIALIAHDQKKDDLLKFVREHREFFATCELFATLSTGQRLQKELGLTVHSVPHGPLGGDLVVGAMVVRGEMDAVFFFRDPLTAQPHEPDVSALLRVCDVHCIPLATNLGTARCLVAQLEGCEVKPTPPASE